MKFLLFLDNFFTPLLLGIYSNKRKQIQWSIFCQENDVTKLTIGNLHK